MQAPSSCSTPRRASPARPGNESTSTVRRPKKEWIPPILLLYIIRAVPPDPITCNRYKITPKKYLGSRPVPRTSSTNQGGWMGLVLPMAGGGSSSRRRRQAASLGSTRPVPGLIRFLQSYTRKPIGSGKCLTGGKRHRSLLSPFSHIFGEQRSDRCPFLTLLRNWSQTDRLYCSISL